MTNGSVHTIILNWRTADMTLRSLEHAVAAMEGIEGGVTVVDNDSGDGSFEKMQAAVRDRGWDRSGRVRVVQSGHNGGFGAGNNAALHAPLADGQMSDHVYLLNSDAFPQPGSIAILRDYLDAHGDVGIVGSYIVGTDGVPHQSAFRFPSIASEFEGAIRFGPITRLLRRHVVPMPIPERPCQVDWVSGASLMMRREAVNAIGGFDETFFLYFEETDLCRRAALAGWSTHYVPESVVAHEGSVSTGMKKWTRVPEYWFVSRQHYFTKNHGRLGAAAANLAHLAGGGLWRLRCVIQRRDRQDPPGFMRQLAGHAVRPQRRT